MAALWRIKSPELGNFRLKKTDLIWKKMWLNNWLFSRWAPRFLLSNLAICQPILCSTFCWTPSSRWSSTSPSRCMASCHFADFSQAPGGMERDEWMDEYGWIRWKIDSVDSVDYPNCFSMNRNGAFTWGRKTRTIYFSMTKMQNGVLALDVDRYLLNCSTWLPIVLNWLVKGFCHHIPIEMDVSWITFLFRQSQGCHPGLYPANRAISAMVYRVYVLFKKRKKNVRSLWLNFCCNCIPIPAKQIELLVESNLQDSRT